MTTGLELLARVDLAHRCSGTLDIVAFNRKSVHTMTYWTPSREVTVLIGFPFGGGSDVVGRPLLARVARLWRWSIQVENVSGENGLAAASAVVSARPDGHTILLGHISTNVIGSLVATDKRSTEDVAGLKPICRIGSQPHILIVRNGFPASTLDGFVSHVRRSPSRLRFGSTGYGSLQHVASEWLMRTFAFRAQHVPFAGSMPAMAALAEKKIDFIFEGAVPAAPFVGEGLFRALAASTAAPWMLPGSFAPLATAGISDFDLCSWWGLFAPPGTPSDIILGWHAATSEALSSRGFQELATSLGVNVYHETPSEFSAALTIERLRYQQLLLAFRNDGGPGVVGEDPASHTHPATANQP